MRITGLRTLTAMHDWGRPIGDANGVFADGIVPVPLVLVDTDDGIDKFCQHGHPPVSLPGSGREVGTGLGRSHPAWHICDGSRRDRRTSS